MADVISNKKTKFNVKINCVIIGTDIPNNIQYILSTNKTDIVFPCLELNAIHKENIDLYITDFLKQYIFVSELELMPQIISLHSKDLQCSKNDLNVVYGFVVKHTININDVYWIPFDYSQTNQYSNLIFEVIQKLK